MTDTANEIARLVACHLEAAGVKRVVLSPGSRNAPLCMAVSCRSGLTADVVVDERSAAFIALGIAAQSGEPVAMVCTSGTAVLNYGPALAEAYYRQIPLIAVTADRPARWVDCLDSQTIRQPGVFANYVKASYDITTPDEVEPVMRAAMREALSGFRGPVHVNVRIGEPIGALADVEMLPAHTAGYADNCGDITYDSFPAATLAGERILIVAGGIEPEESLAERIRRLASCSNVVMLRELNANLPGAPVPAVNCPDVFFVTPPATAPTVVVTVGGAIISGPLKKYLRSIAGLRHIAVAQPGRPDTFGCLCAVVAPGFLDELAAVLEGAPASDFRSAWLSRAGMVRRIATNYIEKNGFTALSAVCALCDMLPANTTLHLSNGMTVRYAQFADTDRLLRRDCNRGVSGIDGCTSTAMGAASAISTPLVLLSGDMSAQYDMGALAWSGVPANFRMAVLDNGGGNIFRHIAATRGLPMCDRCLVADVRLPLRALADAYGFRYFEAVDRASLAVAAPLWLSSPGPAIMRIVTDGPQDAVTYRKLFDYVRKKLD